MLSAARSTNTSARTIAVVVRGLATETAASSSTPPPPPLPSKQSKPPLRTRLNPAPRAPVSHQHQVLAHLPPSFGRNQFLPVADSTRALLESIVAQFNAPIRYAFAYGSGVFDQDGQPSFSTSSPAERPMLDFMFAVTHADHWHSINMQQYPGHYPLHARMFGSSFVARVQDINPGVWFNTFVPMKGATIKYGVTTVDNLCGDLLNWHTLYLAGRMHKPLRIIKDDARVRLTQQVNLTSAVRAALLTLPADFDERALFERIARFSYAGDVRMALPAENRGKVANIVSAQRVQFRELYHRLAIALPGVHWPMHVDQIQQDDAPAARAALLRKLPQHLRQRVTDRYATAAGVPPREADEDAFWMKIAVDRELPNIIEQETARIVRGPSAVQTLKGLVSAGPVKSARYSAQKVCKWWKAPSADSAGTSKP
ncbi:Mmp37-domain-containing protein [Obba rivulosa]|uniref:Phosphatidate cytidylyltransferase, mitochondrial n=1 Tax=Obba rivulosa TaxID=1052685 RepID=A0A8E2B465_9APHY|nr:Mmp37-domain-containing protein [Obba rivulosa]